MRKGGNEIYRRDGMRGVEGWNERRRSEGMRGVEEENERCRMEELRWEACFSSGVAMTTATF